jgi:adenosine deaminase
MEDADIRSLPKALLHDHLDGGLRPATILELADDIGYDALPAREPGALARWFHQEDVEDLVEYLSAFEHAVAVLQTPDALERAAFECALDLNADGVVYAEVRFGPSLHMRRTMGREDAIEAVVAGLARGKKEVGLEHGVIVTAMRHQDDSRAVAAAAALFVGEGVVGFDLAGPEAGYPADDHLAAVRLARESGLGLTIHAGEHDGPESIWRALGRCGAGRIGHGARVIEDCVVRGGRIVELGPLARIVRDQRVPLEICITSNVHTGLADGPADHPVGLLADAGFTVTLNTDNRLMSSTDLTREFSLAHRELGMSIESLGELTAAAIGAGFGDWSARRHLIETVVRPAYTAYGGPDEGARDTRPT